MKLIKQTVAIIALILACANTANAQSLQDLLGKLGGGDAKNTIGSVLEGVLSKSDLTVADLQGNWISTGPAVCFQGDNFLKKAGGAAAATAIENKLAPYYNKYGLNGATLTVDKEGNFELAINKLKLKGTVSIPKGADKGVFTFSFKAVGKISLGNIKTYVQKTSKTMDVMFDATKLMTIIQAVAKYSNMTTAKTLSSLLSQYDGLCVGFAFKAK